MCCVDHPKPGIRVLLLFATENIPWLPGIANRNDGLNMKDALRCSLLRGGSLIPKPVKEAEVETCENAYGLP